MESEGRVGSTSKEVYRIDLSKGELLLISFCILRTNRALSGDLIGANEASLMLYRAIKADVVTKMMMDNICNKLDKMLEKAESYTNE